MIVGNEKHDFQGYNLASNLTYTFSGYARKAENNGSV